MCVCVGGCVERGGLMQKGGCGEHCAMAILFLSSPCFTLSPTTETSARGSTAHFMRASQWRMTRLVAVITPHTHGNRPAKLSHVWKGSSWMIYVRATVSRAGLTLRRRERLSLTRRESHNVKAPGNSGRTLLISKFWDVRESRSLRLLHHLAGDSFYASWDGSDKGWEELTDTWPEHFTGIQAHCWQVKVLWLDIQSVF